MYSSKRTWSWFFVAMTSLVNLYANYVSAQQPSSPDAVNWLRGKGEQLELRLSGTIDRHDGGNIEDAHVRFQIRYNDDLQEPLEAQVVGRDYHVWLPVNKTKWSSIIVTANCGDGARCSKMILRQELRELVTSGLNLSLEMPKRKLLVRVEHDGQDVANATVRVRLAGGAALKSQSDAKGMAEFQLLDNEKLDQLTAWTDQSLIGGYQFGRTPLRDASANSHVISMHRCSPFEVHVKDTDGKPVAGLELGFEAASAPPHYNYLGMPDGYQAITDENGIAKVAWHPDIENAHCYVDLRDHHWFTKSSELSADKLEVTLQRATERKTISVKVNGEDKFTGGFNIKLGSFQAEEDHRIDLLFRFTDADGSLSAEVLPDATYAVFLEDKQCVAKALDLIPYASKSDESRAVELTLTEGIPVQVHLTQGDDHEPLANTWVNIDSDHQFSWMENGRRQSGSLGRDASSNTNDLGVIEIVAPAGKLEASVYLADWHAEETIEVRPGQANKIAMHRKVNKAIEVSGQLLPWNDDQQQVASASLQLQSIDGECADKIEIKADAHGRFQFKTTSVRLGGIAYSSDRRHAGSIVIDDLSKPVEWRLYPTMSFSGRITDQQGNPVKGHEVWASIAIKNEDGNQRNLPTAFYAPEIRTQTDADGHYQIERLPIQTAIGLYANTLDNKEGFVERIDEVYFLPGDQPRSCTTKIGPTAPSVAQLRLEQRFNSLHRDCRLGGYHLMAIIYDQSDKSSEEFVQRQLLDYSEHQEVASYMQLKVNVSELADENNSAFMEKHRWAKDETSVFVCVYDHKGKELGRADLDPSAVQAADSAYEFIKRHLPVKQDAQVKWNKAFQQAKEEQKLVWVRSSQRYCGPCLSLSRWIVDHREILEKEFVILKIDGLQDLNSQPLTQRLTQGRSVGVPFHAIFDADEKLVVDSYGPLGNIGYMSGLEGKRHFKKMLDTACAKLTPQDIQVLVDSLDE